MFLTVSLHSSREALFNFDLETFIVRFEAAEYRGSWYI